MLFDGPNDSNPTPLYYTVARLNKQTQNLAPAILRLKSTNLQFKLGRHKAGFSSVKNDLPSYASEWSTASSGDPYMTGITVTNVGNPNGAPKKNDAFAGDVIVGYYKPLLEDFDGPSFSNQLYFTITNGLTDSAGDRVDTRQLVRLNFNFGTSGINSLQQLDRDTGQVLTVPLVLSGGTNYYLDRYLYGGEGDLFKYNTGAPFVGFGAAVWAVNDSGDWNVSANWSVGAVPNGVGAEAKLGGIIAAPRTVYADVTVTVGTLTFDNANTYNLSGAASLFIQAASGSGYIGVVSGSHKINLPLYFVSDTTISIANGSTLTIADPATIKAGKTVTKTGNLVIKSPLTIESGGALVLGSGAASLFSAPSLATGAKVDVQAGSLAIDYLGRATPAATIKAQLTSGYAAGAWNGAGISTSSAVAGQTALGWKEDVAAQSILIKYTYYGDANLDGQVDISDLGALAIGWQASAVWSRGDFDYSGFVDILDLGKLATNWQLGVNAPLGPSFDEALASLGLAGASVPEPVSGTAGALVGLLATMCRRSRGRSPDAGK